MTRLILMILLAIAVWSYFPETRYWVYDKVRPALTPVFVWQAKKEMNEIARGLQTYERENFGRLPSRRAWPAWLESNYWGDASRDAWGNIYLLTEGRDSFQIVSNGPDRMFQTEDDIIVSRPLSRSR